MQQYTTKIEDDYLNAYIHEVTMIGQNAWGEVYLFSTIEEDADGKRNINIVYGDDIHTIDISNPKGIMQNIRKLESIDNKKYVLHTEDGYIWALRVAYDDKEIVSCGINACPRQVYDFLRFLDCNMKIDEDIKGCSIKEMDSTERVSFVCDLKDMSRYIFDLWEETDKNYEQYVYKSIRPGFFKVGIKSNNQA